MDTRIRVALVAALVLLPCLAGAPAFSEPTWHTETALEAADKLNGCAIGDLDPRHAGNEIATVSANGDVYVVRRSGTAWASERVAKLPGETIQCAIGDLGRRPGKGKELVVVGMKEGEERGGAPGAAHVIWLEGDTWKQELLLEQPALIHGVGVGDIDPDRPGEEILCVGFTPEAVLLWREGGTWKQTPVGTLDGAGKMAVVDRKGALVACQSGSLVRIAKAGGAWKATALDQAPAGLARLAAAGDEALACRDDGGLGFCANGKRADIHKEELKLRGAVLAELDPTQAGVEAATAGYSGKVTVLTRAKEGWSRTTVFTDSAKFHHLTSGQLPACGPAIELAACGYSKRLTVIYKR